MSERKVLYNRADVYKGYFSIPSFLSLLKYIICKQTQRFWVDINQLF